MKIESNVNDTQRRGGVEAREECVCVREYNRKKDAAQWLATTTNKM